MPAAPVILNNTPLVALWGLGKFEIVHDLFGEVWIPVAVQQEFLTRDTKTRQAIFNNTWLKVIAVRDEKIVLNYQDLDRGEAEVLALAEEHPNSTVAIDERKARRYAQKAKIPLIGTLGILLVAKESQIVSAVKPLIEELQNNGLFFDPKLIEKVLEMAGE